MQYIKLIVLSSRDKAKRCHALFNEVGKLQYHVTVVYGLAADLNVLRYLTTYSSADFDTVTRKASNLPVLVIAL